MEALGDARELPPSLGERERPPDAEPRERQDAEPPERELARGNEARHEADAEAEQERGLDRLRAPELEVVRRGSALRERAQRPLHDLACSRPRLAPEDGHAR